MSISFQRVKGAPTLALVAVIAAYGAGSGSMGEGTEPVREEV